MNLVGEESILLFFKRKMDYIKQRRGKYGTDCKNKGRLCN